ncbi:MAG: hypothetical protein IJ168_03445 [Eubacterium sp.]|nr:hypothetical protein [Eubacterium sp.]
MKKIKFPRELSFVLAMLVMPFAIALMTKANLGLSMIAAPTYIISEKVPFLTYGQTEYIFQALVLVVMCLTVSKFRLTYLTSFLTAILYGSILDLFIWLLSPVSMDALWQRIIAFLCGMLLTSLGVALFMNTYLAPCAYDYFVRTVVQEKQLDLRRFKLGFDAVFLLISTALTLLLFRRFIGITWGTLVIVVCNGNIIAFLNKQMNRHFEFFDLFPKLSKHF